MEVSLHFGVEGKARVPLQCSVVSESPESGLWVSPCLVHFLQTFQKMTTFPRAVSMGFSKLTLVVVFVGVLFGPVCSPGKPSGSQP